MDDDATSSFAGARALDVGLNAPILLTGLGLIIAVARHTPFVRHWEEFTQLRLAKLKMFDDDASVDELLHITEGYGVVRVRLPTDSPLIGQTLTEINAGLEHSFVLGIERDKEWLSTPRLTRKLMKNDYLVIYGKLKNLAEHFGK